MTRSQSIAAGDRAAAEAAVAAAERAMLEHSDDFAAFERAANDLAAAEAELRRIDFREQHAAEIAEREKLGEKRKQLEDAQDAARAAHAQTETLAPRLSHLIASFEDLVGQLQTAQQKVDRGVHFEAFGVRDGLIQRVTVSPKLALEPNDAVRLLRAARDLVKLTPLSPQLAEMRASQRSR